MTVREDAAQSEAASTEDTNVHADPATSADTHEEHDEPSFADRAAEAFRRKLGGEFEEEESPSEPEQDEGEVEAAPIEEEPEPTPKKPALERAQEMLAAKRYEQEMRRERKLREEYEARLKLLEEDPVAAFGGPEKFNAAIKKGVIDKFGQKTPEQQQQDERDRIIAELKAKVEAQEAEKLEAVRRQQEAEEIDQVKGFLESQADTEFPVLSAFPWAAAKVREAYYRELGDADEVDPDTQYAIATRTARKVQDAVLTDVKHVLTNKRAAAAVLKDPTVKQVFAELLGVQQQIPQKQRSNISSPRSDEAGKGGAQRKPWDGPKTLTNASKAEVPQRYEADDDEETMRARMVTQVREMQRNGSFHL